MGREGQGEDGRGETGSRSTSVKPLLSRIFSVCKIISVKRL